MVAIFAFYVELILKLTPDFAISPNTQDAG